MTTVYVSAAREAKQYAALIAGALEEVGADVPERWWETITDTDATLTHSEAAEIADRQYRVIERSDAFLCLTPSAGRGAQREIAIASTMRREFGRPYVILVGSRLDSLFDALPHGVDLLAIDAQGAVEVVAGMVPERPDVHPISGISASKGVDCECAMWALTTDEEWEAVGTGQHHPGCPERIAVR